MLEVFATILAVEQYTGNGGGDPDLDSDNDVIRVSARIRHAKSAGHAVGELTAKVYLQWQENGWYDAIASRYAVCFLVMAVVLTSPVLVQTQTSFMRVNTVQVFYRP